MSNRRRRGRIAATPCIRLGGMSTGDRFMGVWRTFNIYGYSKSGEETDFGDDEGPGEGIFGGSINCVAGNDRMSMKAGGSFRKRS